MSLTKRSKRFIFGTVALVLALSVTIGASNLVILSVGGPFCTSSLDRLTPADVAIVLGSDDGAAIRRRSDAARRLLEENIIPRIIISGHPQNRGENEVQLILDYLVKCGIPESKLVRDETGRNTRRTIEYARKRMGENRVILVTDDYHSARTMFLARRAGLNGECFTSESGWSSLVLVKVHLREYLSRTKAVFETYVLGY